MADHEAPSQPRTIGPVTTAAMVGAAVAEISIWATETAAHIDIPTPIEGSISVVFVAVFGYLVRPRKATE